MPCVPTRSRAVKHQFITARVNRIRIGQFIKITTLRAHHFKPRIETGTAQLRYLQHETVPSRRGKAIGIQTTAFDSPRIHAVTAHRALVAAAIALDERESVAAGRPSAGCPEWAAC